MGNFIITVNRESGSSGREIARLLGKKLNLKVYDKGVLEALTEKFKLNEKEIERIKAQKLSLWDDICQFYRQFDTNEGRQYQSEFRKVTSRELYSTERQIMQNLAQKESCIIVGRVAFHIFKDYPDALRVFVYADRDIRIKRLAAHENISLEESARLVDETDKARERFTRNFAGVTRYDVRNYDLAIDVGDYTTEAVAEFLAGIVRRKMQK